MNAPSESVFRKAALASGLIDAAQLADATRRVHAILTKSQGGNAGVDEPDAAIQTLEVTDQQVATVLLRTGAVNRWQAQQLLAGRTRFRLGAYDVVDSIGQGGMGQVFKARHSIMGRTVAVKVLPRDRSTPESIDRFSREIRAQARLDHPNLVRALDAGHEGNVHFLVTEYVPGTDLRHLIRRTGRLSMSTAATIISQAAAGLQHAHDNGLLHRDVKPGNLLVSPGGETKVSDLGLVGTFGDTKEFDPMEGKIVGTADYLSPEQIRDPRNVGPASDVYSLGCTLYYAVTAKVPFPGGTTRDKARAHCEQGPLDPRLLNRDLSDEFVDLIAAMMEKNPARRIATTVEVMERLKPWCGVPLDLPDTAWQDSNVLTASPASGAPSPRDRAEDDAGSGDTQPSFLGDSLRRSADSSSQGSQGTHPIASAADDTLPIVKVEPRLLDRRRQTPSPKYTPTTLFVLGAVVVLGVLIAALLAVL